MPPNLVDAAPVDLPQLPPSEIASAHKALLDLDVIIQVK